MIDSLVRLQKIFRYQFSHRGLLESALTHRSVGKNNNERLEFLGDGVLNFIIGHHLFERFPAASEGELSRLRAHLVRGVTLAALAREHQLGDYLRLGPGEQKSGGFRRESILAGALEAVIGAVYLDGGFDAARDMVLALYQDALAGLSLEQGLKDPKTCLQEYLQSRGWPLPEYRVLSAEGDAHAQIFKVACILTEPVVSTEGAGDSRRKAEQAAAQAALAALTGK